MCGGAAPVHHGHSILPGSKLSCLLLRSVLQDAPSEVTNIHPPLKRRVFVHDITAFKNGRKQGVGGDGRKGSEEVEERRWRRMARSCRSLKEGKEGKNKATTSCRYLSGGEAAGMQRERSSCFGKECGKAGGGLENEKPAPGSEGEGEKKTVRREMLSNQESRVFSEKIHENWCEEVVEDGFWSPRERGGGQAFGIAPTERLKLRRQMAAAG